MLYKYILVVMGKLCHICGTVFLGMICCVLLCAIHVSRVDKKDEKTEMYNDNQGEFISPTPGEISIIASSPCLNAEKPSMQAFLGVKECGFNAAFFNASQNSIDSALTLLKNIDLKLILCNEALQTDECIKFVNKYKDNPIVGGWSLIDEPRFNQLDNLQKYYKKIAKADSMHIIHMNLVGSNIPVFTGNLPDYNSYLKYIQDIFSPVLWSYDMYPLSVYKGRIKVSYDLFYSDLQKYADMSKNTGRPFWAYCQSMAFRNSVVERPVAKESYLRFEAFSALAYGAQGIVYWTYSLRKSTPSEEYISALVDLKGNRSKEWYTAQRVNREIKLFSPIFTNCRMVDCRHTGIAKYRDTREVKSSFGPLKRIVSEKAGVMISHIRNGIHDYLVIINHDIENSQKVNVWPISGCEINVLNVNMTSQNMKISRETIIEPYVFTLNPGGYKIFEWRKVKDM